MATGLGRGWDPIAFEDSEGSFTNGSDSDSDSVMINQL